MTCINLHYSECLETPNNTIGTCSSKQYLQLILISIVAAVVVVPPQKELHDYQIITNNSSPGGVKIQDQQKINLPVFIAVDEINDVYRCESFQLSHLAILREDAFLRVKANAHLFIFSDGHTLSFLNRYFIQCTIVKRRPVNQFIQLKLICQVRARITLNNSNFFIDTIDSTSALIFYD